MTNLPTGTLTFLFSDIEGSTRLLQRLGAAYPDVLEDHKRRLRSAFSSHDGVEVGTEGDSFFVVFRSAPAAVAAAAAAQRAIADDGWPSGLSVKVRVGLHTGEAAVVGGTYAGLDVHRAARIGAAAHGGQVLLSAASAELAAGSIAPGITIRDLGDHRLKDLSRPEHLHQLVIDGLHSEFPPIRGGDPTLDNLPVQLTSFVGRDAELSAAADLLGSARLLTLLGPGGTGKTRLAIELAARVGSTFRDGVRFVPLASVSDPGVVPSAIGQALEIMEAGRGDEPAGARLLEYLRDRQLLLVIDNFEQLVAAAEFLDEVLRAARNVRVLVTSRSTLGIDGEQVFRVPPMALPDGSRPGSPDLISSFEAVSLFVQRARAARPDFAITNDNASAIAEICVRLDGLPLAIELAASRVRILSPQAILSRLGDRLLLKHEAVGIPTRHRALWDTIAWSHDLLEDPERRLFARLSVFNGGGTLGDISALVEGCRQPLGIDVLEGLTSLSDKSLLQAIEDDRGEPRFGMLRTIREFAWERLAASDEEVDVRDRHLEVFLALAEEAEPHLLTTRRRPWLDRLEREIDNFRAALDWATERERIEPALRLGAALWRLWQMRGYLREASVRIQAILAMPGGEAHPRALSRANEAAGGIAHWRGDQPAERGYYEESVRIGRELDDMPMVANALFNLAYAHLPLILTADDDGSLAEGLLREAGEIFEHLGDELGSARMYEARAVQFFFRHQWETASRIALDGASLLRRVDDTHYLAWCLDIIGDSALQLGDLGTARDNLREALALFAAARDLSGIAVVMDELAALAMREGDPPAAMRLAGAASELTATTGTAFAELARRVPEYRPPDRSTAPSGDTDLQAAWDEGRSMTVEEAVAYGLQRQAPETGARTSSTIPP
jgi:predicted ATPase/class 3 adenylate cyclase